MRIGELARRADCPVETVRYYEKAGLLAAPRRSGANYRDYGAAHLERLAFIRRCRALDMSLPEIRALIEAIENPGADCAPVDALLDEHIEHVAARIADLSALKRELDAVRAHCAGRQPASACGIVDTLSRPAAKRERRSSHVRGAK
ncbi:MAG: Cd(II)/Pb(II)-responsive transcriptional regulator [Burkholderiales bacterium]